MDHQGQANSPILQRLHLQVLRYIQSAFELDQLEESVHSLLIGVKKASGPDAWTGDDKPNVEEEQWPDY